MKIYLAGPLFTEAERAFNLELAHLLEKEGHEVYLPQRDTPAASGPGRNRPVLRQAVRLGAITLRDVVQAIGPVRPALLVGPTVEFVSGPERSRQHRRHRIRVG